MAALSCLLKRAKIGGFLLSCRVRGKGSVGVQISRLFADDKFIFCEAYQDQLTYLSWVLVWFEAILGLRINLDKSKLIPIGRMDNLGELALEFGCKVGAFPSSYYGLPLGDLFKSMVTWDEVEERFRKGLIMWIRHYIVEGGRITLI